MLAILLGQSLCSKANLFTSLLCPVASFGSQINEGLMHSSHNTNQNIWQELLELTTSTPCALEISKYAEIRKEGTWCKSKFKNTKQGFTQPS